MHLHSVLHKGAHLSPVIDRRYDEGTAFLPVVSHKRNLPVSDKWTFLALDAEGHDLPSDWYVRFISPNPEGN